MFELSAEMVAAVAGRLDVTPAEPSAALLDTLMWRYTQTVPWESASRIARRAALASTADCPRTPTQFWRDHLALGTGGTCFESNLAFYSLLRALGYEGYLTINNMGATTACHTAIVVTVGEQKWLVDAGLPVHRPLRIDPDGTTQRKTVVLNFAIRPDGPFTYQVERSPHPARNAFTLVDLPVNPAAYWAATTADYGSHGLFLDRIVINKVIDGNIWRFSSSDSPLQMEWFQEGERHTQSVGGDAAEQVAQRFGIDTAVVRAAFEALE